jgi:hypothetical protein
MDRTNRAGSGRDLASRLVGLAADAAPDTELGLRILEVSAEFEDSVGSEDERRSLVMSAVVAWNLSLFEGEEFEGYLAEFARSVPDWDDEVRSFILALVDRKRELYPTDRRYVVRYELSGRGHDLAFRASAAPLP